MGSITASKTRRSVVIYFRVAGANLTWNGLAKIDFFVAHAIRRRRSSDYPYSGTAAEGHYVAK